MRSCRAFFFFSFLRSSRIYRLESSLVRSLYAFFFFFLFCIELIRRETSTAVSMYVNTASYNSHSLRRRRRRPMNYALH